MKRNKAKSNSIISQLQKAESVEQTIVSAMKEVEQVSAQTNQDDISTHVRVASDLMSSVSLSAEEFKNIQLEESNVKLFSDKAELMDKMSEYIANVDNLESENKMLSTQIESLQNQCDQYLLRISELAFENARLKAELENVKTNPEKTHPAVVPPQASYQLKAPMQTSMRVQSKYRHNGYEMWN